MEGESVKITTIIVIGFISVCAMAAATALEITNHDTAVGAIIGFATTLAVALIALVQSSQAKSLLNGTKELAQATSERVDNLEEKVS